jgi:hypothetical protein
MSVTIVRVQYLYPRLNYKSQLNKADYKLGKENEASKIMIT